jgi:hypothetical protein
MVYEPPDSFCDVKRNLSEVVRHCGDRRDLCWWPSKNLHVVDRMRRIHGTGGTDKVAILGAIERGGKVKASVLNNVSATTLPAIIRDWVESGVIIYKDQAKRYIGLDGEFVHGMGEYVRGDVLTNNIEDFWSLQARVEGNVHAQCSQAHRSLH